MSDKQDQTMGTKEMPGEQAFEDLETISESVVEDRAADVKGKVRKSQFPDGAGASEETAGEAQGKVNAGQESIFAEDELMQSQDISGDSIVPGAQPQNFWIYQAKTKNAVTEKGRRPARSVTWEISRHQNETHPGDVVYIWQGFPNVGIWGWGIVDGLSPQGDDGYIAVTVVVNEIFDKFIVISAKSGVFSKLGRYSAPTDTNLRLSREEVTLLNKVITERGYRPPDVQASESTPVRQKRIKLELKFENLTDAAVKALGFAEGFRLASHVDEIHMEHLLLGLVYENAGPAYKALAKYGIDYIRLVSELSAKLKYDIVQEVEPLNLSELPEFSHHAGQAMRNAALLASESDSELIRSRHLFDGLRSVRECDVVKILEEFGVPVFEFPAQMASIDLVDLENNWLSDLRATEDHLGHAPLVTALATFLKNKATQFPLVIGIDAPWGAGKSSVMYLLEKELILGKDTADTNVEENIVKKKVRLSWKEFRSLIKHWPNISINVSPKDPKIETFAEKLKTNWRKIKGWFGSGESAKLRSSLTNDETGKSRGERVFQSVYFNAWRHGSGTQLTASLVNHILNEVANKMPPVEREKFWLNINLKRLNIGEIRRKAFLEMLKSVSLGVAFLLSIVAAAIVAVFKLETWLYWIPGGGFLAALFFIYPRLQKKAVSFDFEKYLKAPDYNTLMGPQLEIERDFKETLKYLRNSNTNLAIFIDDLDRCSPPQVAEVVESINVFFGQETQDCVFILGMHRELVATSLELAYDDLIRKIRNKPSLAEELPFGQRFLEKIVQFVVRLPEPSDANVENYINHLTNAQTETQSKSNTEIEKMTKAHFEGLRQVHDLMDNTEEYQKKVENDLVNEGVGQKNAKLISESVLKKATTEKIANSYDDKSAEVIAVFNLVKDCLRRNPRQYVRFFNTLRFDYYLRAADISYIPEFKDLLAMAKWAVISLEWPNLAGILSRRKDEVFKMLGGKYDEQELNNQINTLVNEFGNTASLQIIQKELNSNDKLNVLLKLQS